MPRESPLLREAAAPEPLPDWANDFSSSLESGACGQFLVHGNVHDRFAIEDRFIGIDGFIQEQMLAATEVIFAYDLGGLW